MTVGDIIRVLDSKMWRDIYRVASRMLHDGRSTHELCSSGEDTLKAQGICIWLEEKRNRKPSSGQLFALKMFIACNLELYGNEIDEITASNVFNGLVR